ncbi:MAG: UxaA family hydrolase [bacterium]
MQTFMGYERADGTAGIRNLVAILPSVSCANPVVEAIAREVPGVVPLLHGHGCGRGGCDLPGHSGTLQNICKNPNLSAVLVVGLGCESLSAAGIETVTAVANRRVERIMIQEAGGSGKATARGIEIARELLAVAATQQRTPQPIDKLIVGLECGGSDAFSGITANPGVGMASDRLVKMGASVILTETTEMIGTSHILAKRAVDEKVASQLVAMITNQEKKTQLVLGPMAKRVISPGNQDGGMSCIREKALGCICKAGSSPINQVTAYGEIPSQKGLIVMDGPGYDTESMTGLAAAGAQIIIFTTGRGNPIGFPFVPVIKVVSTSKVYNHMKDDMDINAGTILEGRGIESVGDEIMTLIEKVLTGEQTKAELNRQNGILCLYTQTTAF